MSRFLKLLAVIITAIALAILAGMSGATFYLWPTSFPDHALPITPQVLGQLAQLQKQRKFERDMTHAYFGAPNEAMRARAQAEVDEVIARLQTELPANPRRAVLLNTFKQALAKFETSESEEKDQFLNYLEQIMNIVGEPSSGELFNVWRYGVPFGWFVKGARS